MKRGGPKHADREQPLLADDVMGLREVAEYLNCGNSTVYGLVKHGQIPALHRRAGRRHSGVGVLSVKR